MAFRTPVDYVNKVLRSTHNQSLDVRTTLHPCLLIPIYHDTLDMGETRKLDLSSLLQAEPFLAPYMGGFTLRLEVYFDPLRNYYSWIDNNDKRSTEDILDAKKHRFVFPATLGSATDNFKYLVGQVLVSKDMSVLSRQKKCFSLPDFSDTFGGADKICVGPLNDGVLSDYDFTSEVEIQDYSQFVVGKNSLADYLGIPQGTVPLLTGKGVQTHDYYQPYVLQPFLTYLNIWRCYHSNNQETVAPYTKGWFNREQYLATRDGIGQDLDFVFFDFGMGRETTTETGIQILDKLFKEIRYSDDGKFFAIDSLNPNLSQFDSPVLNEALNVWLFNAFKPFGGLLPVMYRPDMYRNLLSSDVGKIKRYVSVDPEKGVSIQELREENSWQRVVDRYDISGGRFSEWSRTLWGVTTKKGIHIPDLLAVRSTFVGATNIKATATSESSEGSTQLGQLASVIDNRGAFRPLKVRASEPGVLMVCACLIPSVDYSQGLDAAWTRTNFADDYNPELQRLNWEDVPSSRYCQLPMKQPIRAVVGNAQISYSGDWASVEGFGDSVFGMIPPENVVIGKQIPWIEKMSAVSKLSGEFGNDGMYQYWAARRRYQRDMVKPVQYYNGVVNPENPNETESALIFDVESVRSFSQYGNFVDWQYMFADQSLFKHNFFLQVGISQPRNVKPIGYRYMPSLER